MGALPLAVEYINSDKRILPGKVLEYRAVNIGKNLPYEILKYVLCIKFHSIFHSIYQKNIQHISLET